MLRISEIRSIYADSTGELVEQIFHLALGPNGAISAKVTVDYRLPNDDPERISIYIPDCKLSLHDLNALLPFLNLLAVKTTPPCTFPLNAKEVV